MSSSKSPISIVSLIAKKRDGGELTKEEITAFVHAVATAHSGAIQESQIGAMLMAMYIRGLTELEKQALTWCMVESGSKIGPYPEEWRHLVVDKHSTGGVGDKISIVLVPALIACGVKVPMISGRGLGHTGGTLDKLDTAIKGFSVGLHSDKVLEALAQVGGCISGQTGELCPADKVLYAHRDVTATVTSIPLICASIISKKIAEQLSALVLDVKFGRGGQLTNIDEARSLAIDLATLARDMGTPTTALLTRNDSPVGLAIGNATEIAECIETLRDGPEKARAKDLVHLVAAFGGQLLVSTKKAANWDDGKKLILEAMRNGTALKAFRDICVFQGVEPAFADQLVMGSGDPRLLMPQGKHVEELKAPRDGFVDVVDARVIGVTLQRLGAGRLRSTDIIDPAVGVELTFSQSPIRGLELKAGQVWGRIYHNGKFTKHDVALIEAALEYLPDDKVKEVTGKNQLDDLIVEVI